MKICLTEISRRDSPREQKAFALWGKYHSMFKRGKNCFKQNKHTNDTTGFA